MNWYDRYSRYGMILIGSYHLVSVFGRCWPMLWSWNHAECHGGHGGYGPSASTRRQRRCSGPHFGRQASVGCSAWCWFLTATISSGIAAEVHKPCEANSPREMYGWPRAASLQSSLTWIWCPLCHGLGLWPHLGGFQVRDCLGGSNSLVGVQKLGRHPDVLRVSLCCSERFVHRDCAKLGCSWDG